MAKRRFKNKKVRLVAVSAALATGGAIAALLPSANAAEEKTPDQIMHMCSKARVIDGKAQQFNGISNVPLADSCDFIPEPLEFFDGPTEQVTVEFSNCPPDLDPDASADATWSTTVSQGQGKYSVTQQGGGGAVFGALNLAWLKHEGTLDMTLKSATASESTTRDIPEGKVLHVEFTPRMQRMKGIWRVKINARKQTTVTPAQPEKIYEADEVVEGPVILPGAAGAPGLADGRITPVLTDC